MSIVFNCKCLTSTTDLVYVYTLVHTNYITTHYSKYYVQYVTFLNIKQLWTSVGDSATIQVALISYKRKVCQGKVWQIYSFQVFSNKWLANEYIGQKAKC